MLPLSDADREEARYQELLARLFRHNPNDEPLDPELVEFITTIPPEYMIHDPITGAIHDGRFFRLRRSSGSIMLDSVDEREPPLSAVVAQETTQVHVSPRQATTTPTTPLRATGPLSPISESEDPTSHRNPMLRPHSPYLAFRELPRVEDGSSLVGAGLPAPQARGITAPQRGVGANTSALGLRASPTLVSDPSLAGTAPREGRRLRDPNVPPRRGTTSNGNAATVTSQSRGNLASTQAPPAYEPSSAVQQQYTPARPDISPPMAQRPVRAILRNNNGTQPSPTTPSPARNANTTSAHRPPGDGTTTTRTAGHMRVQRDRAAVSVQVASNTAPDEHIRTLVPKQSHPTLYRNLAEAVGLMFSPRDMARSSTTLSDDSDQQGATRPPRAQHVGSPRGIRGELPRDGHPGDDAGIDITIQSPTPTTPYTDSRSGKTWTRSWVIFPLKVFRARDYVVLEVGQDWDDEALLEALRKSYDRLRGWKRRYFGLKGVGHLTFVRANDSYIYPQRVGSRWISPHKNMRMAYLLKNPSHARGKHELVDAVTRHIDLGVEFVERWKTRRLLAVAGLCALISFAIMAAWGAKTGDWATGSQVGQFHLSMFSLLFIAVAWTQNHEF